MKLPPEQTINSFYIYKLIVDIFKLKLCKYTTGSSLLIDAQLFKSSNVPNGITFLVYNPI